jgi:hypothetical protein
LQGPLVIQKQKATFPMDSLLKACGFALKGYHPFVEEDNRYDLLTE